MFGISNNIRCRTVRDCTPELFWSAVRSELVGTICAEIADALEKCRRGEITKEEYNELKSGLKKRLPIFTPHATFANGRRLNANAIPSGLSMYDIDHIADPRTYFGEHIESRVDELGIALAHVTPSTEGLRLLFIIPQGMDLAAAQLWMSRQLNDSNYDQSVKDMARSSFVVPEDYLLYVNQERLYNPVQAAPAVATAIAEPEVKDNEKAVAKAEAKAEATAEAKELSFRGVPYADIIKQWFELAGGEPTMGERNDKLHRLAANLRYIADNDESMLLQIMPAYGLSESEMKGLIQSACSARWYSLPKLMRQALINVGLPYGEKQETEPEEDSEQSGPPAMPAKLPALIDLLLSRTPDLYKPAVAHAVFPSLATHLHKVRFRYIDNIEHEATLMCVLMAGTGAGKDCISEPINRIMADIRRRDAENLRREREWKNEVSSKGANKDKRQRPEGLVIQEVDPDMTNPAFVMRTAEADEHFLYTKLNEIDQFDALRGSGRSNQQFQIMCLAFDPNNRYGQTRVGTQSITEKVTIRFNWNASTTIDKGKRYFSRVLTDGPISRINFCTIPEREIGADMPVYGAYDAGFDEALRPYIEHLNRATGLIDCPQAFKLAKKLRDENAEFARLSQNRVYENLSFRANVIAYLKACVLYVANECKWDKSIETFIRWSLQYDLWCKMEFFGADIQKEMNSSNSNAPRRGRRNLLELLPNTFTYHDAVRVRQAEGMKTEGTRIMINQWLHRQYIAKISDNDKMTNDNYRKLKYITYENQTK